MVAARPDIDALLIGALYGELDGDERTRLDAHLASHPQDRSALEAMRSTREMLRDAELVTMLGAAEPPPAISARLLQEAARRAPVKVAGVGFFAFLASLLRPLVVNPALSAAAALVLVGGAAGVLYSRGTFKASEPTVVSPNGDQLAQHEGVPSAGPARAEVVNPSGAAAGTIDDYRVALEERQAAADPHAIADRFSAALEDKTGDDRAALNERGRDFKGEAAAGVKQDSTVSLDNLDEKAKEKQRDGLAFQRDLPAKTGKATTAKKVPPGESTLELGATRDAAAATRPGYIAVDPIVKDAPTVLALDGSRADGDAARRELAKREEERKNIAADKSRAAGGGGSANTAPGSGSTAGRSPDPAPPAAAPPKPAQVARDQGKTGGAYDATAAKALDTWARDQHARMVKLVNQGKCTDVGVIGSEIARRNPDYYQANVANDRQIRSCRSYVDRARRAKSDEAKTKAAAPRSPAPAPQQDMESPSSR